MALSFPNISRSYDSKWDRVRFWGHDGALEVGFLVEASALRKLVPGMAAVEAAILAAFDQSRDRILQAASLRYSAWERRSFYVLAPEDFQ